MIYNSEKLHDLIFDFHVYSRVFSENEISEYFQTGKLPGWTLPLGKDKSMNTKEDEHEHE